MNSRILITGVSLIMLFLIFSAEEVNADTIFFEAGVEHPINYSLKNIGSDDSPVVITSKGNGRAVITAGSGYGINLEACRNVTISNLVIKGKGRLSGNSNNGLIVNNCRKITINNTEILGFQHSGLLIQGDASEIIVKNIYSHDNGFAGIHVFGKWPEKSLCKDIYIGHCKVENNPGDPTVLNNHSGNGIIVGACDSVMIEYCEATCNGWDMPRTGNGPVGIWAWHADHVTIQHCISHRNKTSPGAADGGGFDLDGGVTNSIIQYCLSYENEGAGYGIYEYESASSLNNNTLRYNISINDGIKNGNSGVMFWNGNQDADLLRDVSVYNNVIFNNRNNGSAVYFTDTFQKNILLANNIFITDGPALKGPIDNSVLLGNIYWNPDGNFQMYGYSSFEDWARGMGKEILKGVIVGKNINPLLWNPGKVTLTDPDSLNMETLSGFILKKESPVINKGLDLLLLKGLNTGGIDFFGQSAPLGVGFEPGIYEFRDATAIPAFPEQSNNRENWLKALYNPAENGTIYLNINNPESHEILKIMISDIHGRILKVNQFHLTGETQSIKTDVSFTKGLYFVSTTMGNKKQTIKIIL